jgi:hypothetical protein
VKAIIDTNVLRVASGQHAEASPDCVAQCVQHLLAMKRSGITVIDDGYRILREYLKNPALMKTNAVGGQFLKWLLQNQGNPVRVEQVSLTETAEDCFAEFPEPALEPIFDAPDRKFAAVAHAHPDKPPVWQATDCKWLDWWPALAVRGVRVEFLCPTDVCRFHTAKFPESPTPELPGA